MDDKLLSYRSETSEDDYLLDFEIPEKYELALGSILLPDESLLYKEKPSKHKIGKRNFIYLTLTLVALLYIPFVSIAFSVVAFSVPSVRNTEGMFMLGLMLFDIVLILVWLGYYHTLSECYIVTNRRLIVIRPESFGGSLSHIEFTLSRGTGDHDQIKITHYEDGTATLNAHKLSFGWVSNGKLVEDAVRYGLVPPIKAVRKTGKSIRVEMWLKNIIFGFCLCLFFSVILPLLVHEASYLNYDGNLFGSSSSGDVTLSYDLTSYEPPKSRAEAFYFMTTMSVTFVFCTVGFLIVVIRATRGLSNIVYLRTAAPGEEVDDSDRHQSVYYAESEIKHSEMNHVSYNDYSKRADYSYSNNY